MKLPRRFSLSLGALALGSSFLFTACQNAPEASEIPALAEAHDAAFVPVAERRTNGIMEQLDLANPQRAALVQRYVLNFMLETKAVNEGMDAPEDVKHPLLVDARETLYAGFEAASLTEEERLVILNGLSANHYRINCDAFEELVPNLTEEEKQYIHEQFADVTHEAILLNSGREKAELFIERRGRINNYLSRRGYDLKALSEARNARIKGN
jgi:hypothetical protein